MLAAFAAFLALADNSALNPVPRGDAWWTGRHQQVLDIIKSGQTIEMALIGDSITHGWGGQPQPNETWKGAAPDLYDKLFGPYHPINLGFSGDRTQHVLWRLDNGELDNYKPKVCMVMIGTNNMGTNTPEEIAEGVTAVVEKIHAKAPAAKVLLCSILPREWENGDVRKKVAATNEILAKHKWADYVAYTPCWDGFLNEDNRMIEGLMPDQLHPNDKGYEVWADMIRPTLKKLMGG